MTTDTSLRLARSYAAPRERIFRAWTDAQELAQWWWPARFATLVALDLRAGGAYRFESTGLAEGKNMAVGGSYREVAPPERLVFTWKWDGEATTSLVTLEFHARADGSEVVLMHTGLPGVTVRDNHVLGWGGCFDRLEAWL